MCMSVYEVIVEPKRRQILDMLLERPHIVSELVEALGISQPGVSRHLRVLREAGLVRVRQDAQMRRYELEAEPLKEIDRWLEDYRRQWAERFDRLDDYMEKLQNKEAGDESE